MLISSQCKKMLDLLGDLLCFSPGAIGLIFTAIGVFASGTVISKLKPRPRILAAWNVFVELLDVVGYMSFAFIGCPAEDLHGTWKSDGRY